MHNGGGSFRVAECRCDRPRTPHRTTPRRRWRSAPRRTDPPPARARPPPVARSAAAAPPAATVRDLAVMGRFDAEVDRVVVPAPPWMRKAFAARRPFAAIVKVTVDDPPLSVTL